MLDKIAPQFLLPPREPDAKPLSAGGIQGCRVDLCLGTSTFCSKPGVKIGMTHGYIEHCLFCRIAAGHLPAHFVYESPKVVAFLDIRPIRTGHIQIIPRAHFDYYDTIPLETLTEMASVGQQLAPILRDLFAVERVAFLLTGGDIPHAHAHVVPMVAATDITSRQYIAEQTITFQDRPRVPDSELSATANSLRSRLQG